ncbi:unnamed protein product [Bursaphelenchus okinawaensis]|uniref:Transcription initiation factor TFIID subunit 9 n=1 Tax=Bursaphelenchus okinawaensis TaxID=465554 RepID=A0A811KFL8_9BILA|nr:unnamed protein product [Bursaphelenchus okinawaensis]CAG9102174.1 unnamed protein product [Bursaphelenchus okinawaensis]
MSSKSKAKDSKAKQQDKNQPAAPPALTPDFPGLVSIEALMRESGIQEWDKGVSFQVHDMAVQMIKNIVNTAESVKEHREGKTVDEDDLAAAIDSFRESLAEKPLDEAEAVKTKVHHVNAIPLPTVKQDYGYHLPAERYLQLQSDFVLKDDFEESIRNALASSYETSFPPPPTKKPHMDTKVNVQHVQHAPRIVRPPPSENTGTFRITVSSNPATVPTSYVPVQQGQPQPYVQYYSAERQQVVQMNMGRGNLVQQSVSETEENTVMQAFQTESDGNTDFD